MLEGKIIKFYRKKAGLTQEQLGRGICSVTHVSKIERGETSYSPEIIQLFSERLHIDIEQGVRRLEDIKRLLHRWHNAIIMQKMIEVEKLKKELEETTFIGFSNYDSLYRLLQARYYILQDELEKTYAIIQQFQLDDPDLPLYEKNLLLHIWGIYYISNYNNSSTENHQKAVKVLKKIDKDEYRNPEYYYHLAVAYYWINSKVNCYAYAEKALRHFKETNNYLRSINAESLMLLQLGDDIHVDFKEMTETYMNLIHDAETLHAPDKKEMLLNNLGYEHSKRKDYAGAQKYYKEALRMADKPSVLYLQRLHNYLGSCFEGKLLRKTAMLNKAKEGMSVAKELDNRLYKILFRLLIYRIEGELDQYYSFIEKEALPYFESNNHAALTNRYGKQLYHHFVKLKQYEKAVQISNIFMDAI
ncbi:helix-turn-helix domain-containing protein [Sporosarcina sp. NPDC096371]|uniref:helix-turn-helix domain-containing protein n=1 Tax=Sporosarcina sp. NPDC096371 TaxID=3364530 RepID=UPI00382AD572